MSKKPQLRFVGARTPQEAIDAASIEETLFEAIAEINPDVNQKQFKRFMRTVPTEFELMIPPITPAKIAKVVDFYIDGEVAVSLVEVEENLEDFEIEDTDAEPTDDDLDEL